MTSPAHVAADVAAALAPNDPLGLLARRRLTQALRQHQESPMRTISDPATQAAAPAHGDRGMTRPAPNERDAMTTTQPDLVRLDLNARSYRYDAVLDHAADLFFTDRDRWNRLPSAVKSQCDIYMDLRQHYRDAVAAGVISDDRGPAA